jgi:hypothetical protein
MTDATDVGRRENTCQALQCPEDHNMTTLVSAVNYKYYSMYPVFPPPGNCDYSQVSSLIECQCGRILEGFLKFVHTRKKEA